MYMVQGRSFTEDPSTKLGGGSEGAVYPFPDDPQNICVKLFHEPDVGDAGGRKIAEYRANKVPSICGLNLSMPDHFIIPKTPTLDQRGWVNGFLMRRVPKGMTKLMKILDPSFRNDHQIGLKEVLELGSLLFKDLAVIHGKGLVIRDINMGCVMINPQLQRAWVDADSWGYPGYPSLATTDMFAHPDFYPDLQPGNSKLTEAKPHHDRFSFTSMLVLMAVHGAHPFRMGAHPKVKSLQERTQQGITIFDPGVVYPAFLPRPETLSDKLLEKIIAVLKRKTTDSLDPAMLHEESQGTVTCKSCMAQYHHSRQQCPKCKTTTTVDLGRLVELLIEEAFTMSNVSLLFAQVIGDVLYMTCCDAAGKLVIISLDQQRKTTTLRTSLDAVHGARYRFFGTCLAVCPDPLAEAPAPIDLYKIEPGGLRKLDGLSTGVLKNETAVFDCSFRYLYRTAGNTLLRVDLFNGLTPVDEQICQVHRNQTWFTVDHTSGANREAIFGYHRALKDWQWFIVHRADGEKRFTSSDVDLPLRRGEKQDDFVVYFNATSILLVRSTRCKGHSYVRYSIIGLDGKVLKDVTIAQGDPGYDSWEHLRGKLFQAKSILHVTPNGIVRQSLADDRYEPMKETQGVILDADLLVPFGKSVGIIRKDRILTLRKK